MYIGLNCFYSKVHTLGVVSEIPEHVKCQGVVSIRIVM